MAIRITLKEVLKSRGMGVTELADHLHRPVVEMATLGRGEIEAVRLSTLNELCRELNCQPGELLAYTEDEA